MDTTVTTVTTDTERSQALKEAAFASLQGVAKTKGAKALVAALLAEVVVHEIRNGTHRHKPGAPVEEAIGALLADLLVAQSDVSPSAWVYRSLQAKGFSGGPVGYKPFKRALDALKDLGLVEHAEGVTQFITSAFGPTGVVVDRRAARFTATPALLELAVKHRLPPQRADSHFTFQYELPKAPLQKREAKVSNPFTRKQARGRPMVFDHTPASRQLEADVSDLNDFLERQKIDGGVHQGYIRIFQNGDDAGFHWNYGGRLYSQPPDKNYQQLSKERRLKIKFNGEAVAEIDIRASYLSLFYAWHGSQLDLTSDPYDLPGFGLAGRDAVKLWMVATFGSPKPISRWPAALLKDYEEGHKELDRKVYSAKKVREAALLTHPLMERWGQPHKGRIRTWADLMYEESVVVVSTMVALMRDHDVPSLAVHDSLLVPRSAVNTAAHVLRARFRSVTHRDVQLTSNGRPLMVS
jgi:hypothetical protein